MTSPHPGTPHEGEGEENGALAARRVRRGFGRGGFGERPAGYDRGRPEYPGELFGWLSETCGLGVESRVFEVGAGTGRATVRLLAAGASVVAIEPDGRLGSVLRERFAGLIVLEVPFERAGLAAGGFDLGVAATSFHWVRQGSGLRRALAALRPGGWWAMWWTHFGAGTDDAFQAAIRPLFGAGDGKRVPFDLDAAARRRDLAAAGFVDVRVEATGQSVWYETAALVELYRSFSAVMAWTEARRGAFLAEVGRIADERFGGRVERRFTTTVYAGRRPM